MNEIPEKESLNQNHILQTIFPGEGSENHKETVENRSEGLMNDDQKTQVSEIGNGVGRRGSMKYDDRVFLGVRGQPFGRESYLHCRKLYICENGGLFSRII